MTLLLIGLLVLPALAALLVVGVRRKAAVASRIALLATVLALVCGLGLLLFGERDVPLPLTWLPGSEPWSLHVGGLGLYALVVTNLCALATCIRGLSLGEIPEWRTDALFLVGLAASNGAFLFGHFLARYVALEIVALIVAAVALTALHPDVGSQAASFVYLMLRVGDAGLLAAILLLRDATGTLVIGEALARGAALDGAPQMWIAGCLVLAVWVKVGAWPFHSWLRVGAALLTSSAIWAYGVVMPNLGLYLLYRVAPLLFASGLNPLMLGFGVATMVPGLWQIIRNADGESLVIHGNSVVAGLALIAVSQGAVGVVALLLLVVAPIRMWLWWRAEQQSLLQGSLSRSLESFGIALRNLVEDQILDRGPVALAQAVIRVAEWLRKWVERAGEDALIKATWTSVQSSAETLQNRLEHGRAGAGPLGAAAGVVLYLARQIQRLHTGRLRIRLTWVVLTLATALVVTLLVL